MRKIFLATLMCLFACSIHAQSYSIAKRWNIKAGYSRYVTEEYYKASDKLFIGWEYMQKRSSNYRIEGNYGVLPCLEVGLYAGLMTYPVFKYNVTKEEYDSILYQNRATGIDVTKESALAPMFGVNVNFHLLPFLVKKEDCRWDLYVCAKYGGCYFTKIKFPYTETVSNSYKHEFGIGVGGSVYFWKLVGLYTECSFGRYSFLHTSAVPSSIKNYFNIRGGITFKWHSKKRISIEK
jgi:hypothetical protein